jgi:hypothetical protein
MIRSLPGIALLLGLAACSDSAELPTVELGGPSGARLMTGGARTPYEAYDFAYSNLSRQHYNVTRNLDSRSRNLYGARVSMESILASLETMKTLSLPAEHARFDAVLARYRGWHKDVERDTWGGSFLNDFDVSRRELLQRFHPADVQLVADLPGTAPAAKPAPVAPAPAPGPAPPVDPKDRAEAPLKPPATPAPQPPPPVERTPAATPQPTPPTPGISPRLLFRAWDRAHDDLVEAYKAKKDCREKYADVQEALRLLKSQLPADKQAKLQFYLDYYASINEKTKEFKALPDEKTRESDIVDELNMAARVIRKDLNPEK